MQCSDCEKELDIETVMEIESLTAQLKLAEDALKSLMTYQGIIYNAGGVGAIINGEKTLADIAKLKGRTE